MVDGEMYDMVDVFKLFCKFIIGNWSQSVDKISIHSITFLGAEKNNF